MTKAEEAVILFHQGFNCAQAVLSVFAPDLGLDLDTALKVSQGFGAGIGRSDEICGSLSGAIMAIGLRYGAIRGDDAAAKEKTYAVVHEFVEGFKTRHGSVACTDLIGYNLSDPQQYAEAKTRRAATERCPAFVRDAVTLVEKVL
jgi:C_GCAxxG_C_C family probable redox protein